MNLIKEVGGLIGGAIGVGAGIALAPIAIALGISIEVVKKAIEAGCKTQEEVKEFLEL